MTGHPWRAVVIGVGNPYRRDDGVGPAVIDRLRQRVPLDVRLDESDGEPSQLLELWSEVDLAIVVDAVRTVEGRPGRIHRRNLETSVSGASPASSHRVELGDAVALAQAVDRMPGTLVMYGVEVSDISFGPGLSPAVESAADAVVAEILTRLSHIEASDVSA
jgi:hydrogenase maturation protease